MSCKRPILVILVLVGGAAACGDEVLYRYEADVLPYSEGAGWVRFDRCEEANMCFERVAGGFAAPDPEGMPEVQRALRTLERIGQAAGDSRKETSQKGRILPRKGL